MRVKLAKTAGFCMGVRRAMDITLKTIARHGRGLFTFGPLIHNPQVLDLLRERGVEICHSPDEVGENCPVIIRAHGVPPQERDALRERGATVIDATCPRVLNVQSIIRRHARNGGFTVIAGDADHPEVAGLMGYAGQEGMIVSGREDVARIPPWKKLCVVAQTTQNRARYEGIAELIRRRFPGAEIHQTVCDSTQKRQDEAVKMTASVDAVVVVGGKNSANTARLTELVRESGKPVFQVETDEEIDRSWFENLEVVGVTAGASTPNWIIQRVVRKVENIVPSSGTATLLCRIRRIFNLLVESDLYGAVAAGCLSYVAAGLQSLPFHWAYFLIAMAYVYSMHLLNRFTDREAGRLNDPARAEFYEKHGSVLKGVGIASILFALTISLFLGLPVFLFLLAASVGGVTYSLSFIPSGRLERIRYRRLKDIPGSKTLFIALAWAGVTSLVAPLSTSFGLSLNLLATFLVLAAMVLIRSAAFDLRDIQGDLIVGKETIPIVLGEKHTQRLLALTAALTGLAFLVLPPLGVLPFLSYGLVAGIFYMGYCLQLVFRHEFVRSERLELLMDGGFILQGLIVLIWRFADLPL
ncbi:MAG: 4-hydroxy-3-methylbut-2-enyl diphosphate reductase [Deltaproteobacteria bacterium]|nr:4-hydroxy-3-methylbut-2-enyl diphosphate reductase [Deltaproteobacteria bacterium]